MRRLCMTYDGSRKKRPRCTKTRYTECGLPNMAITTPSMELVLMGMMLNAGVLLHAMVASPIQLLCHHIMYRPIKEWGVMLLISVQ